MFREERRRVVSRLPMIQQFDHDILIRTSSDLLFGVAAAVLRWKHVPGVNNSFEHCILLHDLWYILNHGYYKYTNTKFCKDVDIRQFQNVLYGNADLTEPQDNSNRDWHSWKSRSNRSPSSFVYINSGFYNPSSSRWLPYSLGCSLFLNPSK